MRKSLRASTTNACVLPTPQAARQGSPAAKLPHPSGEAGEKNGGAAAQGGDQSTFAPDAFTTGAQLPTSLRIKLLNCAGVLCSATAPSLA